MNTGPGL